LRDYGVAGQLGLEVTPQEYIARMTEVFRLARDLLAEDGTLWLNLGDSYAGSGRGGYVSDTSGLQGGTETQEQSRAARGSQLAAGMHESARQAGAVGRAWVPPPIGLKQKDLCGIPWRVAFALQADGWYLRQDIIWHKPNPMPESVTDRCTKAHEYLFLLSKSERYYWNTEAMKEPAAPASIERWTQDIEGQRGSDRVPGKTNGTMKAVGGPHGKGGKNAFRGQGHFREGESGPANREGRNMHDVGAGESRNKRSVWTVATEAYRGAHFAVFPKALIEPCILAGSRVGDIIFDPFFGSGTTGEVAQRLGRQWIGAELNPAYEPLQKRRTAQTGMPL